MKKEYNYNTDKDYRDGYEEGFRYFMVRREYHKDRAGVSHYSVRTLDDMTEEIEKRESLSHGYKAGWNQAIKLFKGLYGKFQ